MSGPVRRHIPEIDALRGIAAVAVAFVFHSFFFVGQRYTGPLDGLPVFTWLYDYGWTMVDLFFVISGFVFSHVYLDRGALAASTTARSFFVARVARLYPLHLLTLLLVIPSILLGGGGQMVASNLDVYHFGLNLFMLQGVDLSSGFSFNVVSWSISVEFICYLAFFLAARSSARTFASFSLLAILFGIALELSGDQTAIHIGRGICGFFAGYWTWRLRNQSIPTVILVAFAALPFALAPSFMNYGIWLSLTAFPAAVLLAERVPFLSSNVFQWLGARSYSIYLWHTLVYYAAVAYIPNSQTFRQENGLLVLACAIAVVLVISDISYRRFETPMRHLIRRKFGSAPAHPSLA